MNSAELISSFAEFAREKNMDKTRISEMLEEVMRAMIRKKYGSDENFDVIVNAESGDLEMRRVRTIVADDSEDLGLPDTVSLSEARKVEPDFEIGEEFAEDIKLEDFGRRIVLTARQTLIQKIKDIEKDSFYRKYSEQQGDIITAEVYQVLGREIILLDKEGNELVLPKGEQIPKDRFRKGDVIRAVIHKVDLINGVNPKVILSRTSPEFLERLFEQEIPEITDGLIAIRKIVREPGERAKVAVESFDDRIDPVGACVGMKGSRIHSIVRELNNENIDVINYTDNLELYISRTLNPARISSTKVEENGRVSVFLKPDQVPLAIGKGGFNIKLASRLVGMEIDVFRDAEDFEEEDDVELVEFEGEIENWILEELSRIGLDTARSVLDLGRAELIKRSDLEEETIDYLLDLLQKEFEE
ncbi:transcription termination factor NusA [Eisenibacter elegans]|jgi:N utilization substance protein A|uniref:transcription termination factor NusA n=1 Tax=Eisenibacter elegans TaxID=997 RepID=UPI00047E0137|nr:transcription termination factor NusA [Eisenibacter elegans]